MINISKAMAIESYFTCCKLLIYTFERRKMKMFVKSSGFCHCHLPRETLKEKAHLCLIKDHLVCQIKTDQVITGKRMM